jgi:serine/threonine protein kinase
MKQAKSLESSAITDRFEDNYVLEEELYKGGTGIIWKAHKGKDLDTKVAIKFYVPTELNLFFQISSMEKLLKPLDRATYDAEFSFLKKVKHPGLQELISFGEIKGDKFDLFLKKYEEAKLFSDVGSIHFLVSKYVEGYTFKRWIEDLSEKVSNNQMAVFEARKLLIRAIVEIIELLSYIHNECKYLHGDINSNNIIVHASSNRPILIDFGNSRCFDPKYFNDNDKTTFGYLTQNYPPQLHEEIKKELQKNNSNTTNKGKIKALMFPGLDL